MPKDPIRDPIRDPILVKRIRFRIRFSKKDPILAIAAGILAYLAIERDPKQIAINDCIKQLTTAAPRANYDTIERTCQLHCIRKELPNC